MSALTKPIPALYTVYILRSTIRNASVYIGSTPNPPRRLKQHNGEVKGGAAKTSRPSLRPWEMVAIVSGFPGMMAALKFEWALTNPHLSLHIPSEERITVFTQRKRNGQPKRPRASIASILSNLHLLLRVPSFSRWPLNLHFFSKGAYDTWREWTLSVDEPLRKSLSVHTDFGPDGTASTGAPVASDRPWGINALPLNYLPLKDYAEKARDIFSFEQEGNCVHCKAEMPQGEGLYAVCPNEGCEAVGHLQCWSHHIISGDNEEGAIVPVEGRCPSCKGDLRWVDMMKELSLRVRDPKEVEKLLKKKRKTQV